MNHKDINQWRICTAIMASDTQDALAKMKAASTEADLLEIRLDAMQSFDLDVIIESSSLPLVVTYRDQDQGGFSDAACEKRISALIKASHSGADFIDMELTVPADLRKEVFSRKRDETKVIISHHFFEPSPFLDVEQMVDRVFEKGADLGKVIGYASDWPSNLDYLSLVQKKVSQGFPLISFAMGMFGRPSRILSPLMGAPWTYASLSADQKSAPGQISASDMRRIWKDIYEH
jgi:3-dehydroquinate dehydratase type I